jgi:hypothetical protein
MRTTIDLPDDLMLAARHAAIDRRMSLRTLIATALRQWLEPPAKAEPAASGRPQPRRRKDSAA